MLLVAPAPPPELPPELPPASGACAAGGDGEGACGGGEGVPAAQFRLPSTQTHAIAEAFNELSDATFARRLVVHVQHALGNLRRREMKHDFRGLLRLLRPLIHRCLLSAAIPALGVAVRRVRVRGRGGGGRLGRRVSLFVVVAPTVLIFAVAVAVTVTVTVVVTATAAVTITVAVSLPSFSSTTTSTAAATASIPASRSAPAA